jgi:hypothetical protein
MKCPMCDGELQNGQVAVHAPWWSLLLWGFSYQNCHFRHADGGPMEEILPGGEWRQAFRCVNCKTVVLPRSKA